MNTTLNTTIRAENLTVRFGNFTAVNHINFEVPPGQIFGFLGPNGSGKTSTIRTLLGLIRPTEGTAYILGEDIRLAARRLLRQIGYVSQKFSLYRDLTVLENLTFFGRGYGLWGSHLQTRINVILDMAGLQNHQYTLTRELSGGWAQRLALGTAILHSPRLIFLDEPTAGVDPISRRDFWELLYQLASEGVTIFVTTHYMDEAEHCENLGFIYDGQLIALGSPESITRQTIHGEVVSFEASDIKQALALTQKLQTQLQAETVNLFGASIHVVTQQATQAKDILRRELTGAGLTIRHMDVQSPSLEDTFIQLAQKPSGVS